MSEIASYASLKSTSLQSAKGRTPANLLDVKATGVASDSLPIETDAQAINNIALTYALNGCAVAASVTNFSGATTKASVVFTAPETAYYQIALYTQVQNLAGAESVSVGLWPVNGAGQISSVFPISAGKIVNTYLAGLQNSELPVSRTDIVLLTAGAKYCFAANANSADNEAIAAFGNTSFTASIGILQ